MICTRKRLENMEKHAEMKVKAAAAAAGGATSTSKAAQRSRQLVVNLGSYLADHALSGADGRRRHSGEMASVHSEWMSADHSRLAEETGGSRRHSYSVQSTRVRSSFERADVCRLACKLSAVA